MASPILLIAPEAAALPVADALRRDLDKSVEIAPSRFHALSLLRRSDFALVLFDEGLAAADPDSAELIYSSSGATPVLEVNFAISSATRVVRQTRAALVRRTQDEAQARTAVTTSLQNELGASLTGLLLESQLALREALPEQVPKLQHLVELAGGLRNLLRA